jgi:hypothetical protein
MNNSKSLLQFIVQFIVLFLLLSMTATSCEFEVIDPPPPEDIALKSFHGRYITAKGEGDNWTLGQETELNDCGRFILHHLANGKIALQTCHEGRYVMAPENGSTRQDWLLRQETKLDRCGHFDLYELGNDKVAFKTCDDRFLTGGDGDWPGELAWTIVGETYSLEAWEIMTLLPQP